MSILTVCTALDLLTSIYVAGLVEILLNSDFNYANVGG